MNKQGLTVQSVVSVGQASRRDAVSFESGDRGLKSTATGIASLRDGTRLRGLYAAQREMVCKELWTACRWHPTEVRQGSEFAVANAFPKSWFNF